MSVAAFDDDPRVVERLVGQLPSSSARTQDTFAPFTGRTIAAVPVSTADEVEEVVAQARAAQPSWATTALEERARILLDFHDLVLDRQSDILDLIQEESGKARKHAFEEVAHVAMTARYYGLTAARHLGPDRRIGAFPGFTKVLVNRVPKGVVGIISPWNYPFTMGISDGLPALLAGNVVVHRPDTQTALSALVGVELLREAGLPDDVWRPVCGPGPVVGTALVGAVDYVCFTGSTRTGRTVATQAAARLVGASLELGGKNPMLICADASLSRAAEGAVRGCFSSAGQLCVSMERLYVADEIYERFVERFLHRVSGMKVAGDRDFDTDMGSLISQLQLATVTEHVEDAVAKGATVLAGGRARPDLGPLFFEPTVLSGVTPAMTCYGTETFGPVVSIYRFHDEAEAVERANASSYGLNASIFSRDLPRARRLAAQVRCGTVNINEAYAASFASIDSPMGGMGQSGLGRRQGAEGIHRFTDPQAVATQRGLRFAAMPGLSDRAYAKLMTASLRGLKKLGRP
ncbi:MAG: succinic semialdehyde dehydrogenase [Nocardioidaceae bacterium]